MKKHAQYLLLFFIIILASILRLWQFGEVPVSPDWDEAALGYNAYSILQTGRDEYGEFLPIILRSFDDYKPALYAYFIIPLIKLFGLTVFAVRFPSAIFGILTVLATFFLLKELFKKNNIALLASFLLAVSPWHIQFSRIAFEANVGLAFNVFSALFFLWSLKKPWFLVLSAVTMAINLYVYQSEKVFTPLLLLALVVVFRKELLLVPRKYIMISITLGLFISLPILHYTLTNKEALSRAQDVSIIANAIPILEGNVQRLVRDRENHDYMGLVLDNRRIIYLKNAISGYLSHFDFNWVFIKGDIARHQAPNMGLLYLWELPFLLIGIHQLLFRAFPKKTKIFLISWLLIVPVPASVTSDVPHAVRTLNFLPTFQIFTAIGLLTVIMAISNIRYQILRIQIRYLMFVMCFIFFVFNFSYYINQYFVQQNYFHAKYWQYGYENIVNYLVSVHNNYNKIIVSNKQPLDQAYIFFLFYSKYDPAKYLAEGGTKSGVLEENGNKFLNFEFRSFDYYKENKPNILLVGGSSDFSEIFKTIKRVDYPNGEVAIRVVEKD